ncbi:hypothetical protein EXS56_02945 [Candidatus Kaiserbacteria bacterium]|nr:hypothetical protein [Candidatus Kaiserbacteria bacterium]
MHMRKLFVIFLFAALAALLMWFTLLSKETPSLKIVHDCAEAKDHSACYEAEVSALYPKLSVVHIFDVVREIRREDPSYQFCHVLAHKIGERVVAEDPERWIDAIPLNPSDGLCSNGFIHGVVGGRFRAEVLDDATLQKLLSDFRRACEPRKGWSPSSLDQAICYHGLGHLYDFITNANLPKALDICTQTTTQTYRRVCIEGVFMQIYQPLEPDDFLMIEQMPVKPTKDTVRQFCARFADTPAYEGACLRESWPLHAGMTDGTGVKSFCSDQPNAAEETACYESATAIIGRLSLGSSEKAASACEKLPQKWQDICFRTAAQAVLEENRDDASKSIALCALAQGPLVRSCMLSLATQAAFIFGQNRSELNAFCAALPADIRGQCD